MLSQIMVLEDAKNIDCNPSFSLVNIIRPWTKKKVNLTANVK